MFRTTQRDDGIYCDGQERCVAGHGCEPGARRQLQRWQLVRYCSMRGFDEDHHHTPI
ncbi:MAG: hypothetical protein M3O46_01045 [Myxococcota bacterium]|nr:hypothetical protein [Myxococcota bacterium]